MILTVLALLLAADPVSAQLSNESGDSGAHRSKRRLTLCPSQDYALCEAATCTATGGTIQGPAGVGTFPEASCLCPIFHGQALANLHGGNMQGSCDQPADGVWSLYPPGGRKDVPQESAGWQVAPTPIQNCRSTVNGTPLYFAGCFSYACEDVGTIKGARVAQCFCRMLTTEADQFATRAGQCNPDVCNEIPEGLAPRGALNIRQIRHGAKCE